MSGISDVLIKTRESRSKEENTVDMMVQACCEMNCGGVVSDIFNKMNFNQWALALEEDLPSDSWILELLDKMEAMMEKSRAQPPKNLSPLRVVLLGKTGSGKSASGNTILGRKAFKEDLSFESVTETCSNQHTVVDGRKITVIDTPGLLDTEMPLEELKGELEKCVEMSVPGPHAFLLVIRLGVRFTEEERDAVQWIQENFGEGALKYTIVLLTHGDELKGKPVEDFLCKIPALSSLTEHFGGGYHVFNNKSKDSTQVRELKEKIEAMLEENGGANYTSEMYKEVQRKIREKVERQKAEEERKKKLAELELKIERGNNRIAETYAAVERMQMLKKMEKDAKQKRQGFREEEKAAINRWHIFKEKERVFREKEKRSRIGNFLGLTIGAPLLLAATVVTGGTAGLILAAAGAAGAGVGLGTSVMQIVGIKTAKEAAAAAAKALTDAVEAGTKAEAAGKVEEAAAELAEEAGKEVEAAKAAAAKAGIEVAAALAAAEKAAAAGTKAAGGTAAAEEGRHI